MIRKECSYNHCICSVYISFSSNTRLIVDLQLQKGKLVTIEEMNSEKRFLLMTLLLHCTVDQAKKKLFGCGSKIASKLNYELENETKQEDGYRLEFGSTSKKAVIIKPTLNKLFVLKEEIQKLFGIDIAKDCLEQVLYTCIEKDVDSDLMKRQHQVRLELGEIKLEPQF